MEKNCRFCGYTYAGHIKIANHMECQRFMAEYEKANPVGIYQNNSRFQLFLKMVEENTNPEKFLDEFNNYELLNFAEEMAIEFFCEKATIMR